MFKANTENVSQPVIDGLCNMCDAEFIEGRGVHDPFKINHTTFLLFWSLLLRSISLLKSNKVFVSTVKFFSQLQSYSVDRADLKSACPAGGPKILMGLLKAAPTYKTAVQTR